MAGEYDDILDGLFHAAAWAAYLEQAQAEQGWPDPEATRVLAYRYYEAWLAEKNRNASKPKAITEPLGIDQAAIA